VAETGANKMGRTHRADGHQTEVPA